MNLSKKIKFLRDSTDKMKLKRIYILDLIREQEQTKRQIRENHSDQLFRNLEKISWKNESIHPQETDIFKTDVAPSSFFKRESQEERTLQETSKFDFS